MNIIMYFIKKPQTTVLELNTAYNQWDVLESNQ